MSPSFNGQPLWSQDMTTISRLAQGVLMASALTAAAALPSSTRIAAQVDSAGVVAPGARAPDFSAPGATRYGLLEQPVSLSEFNGKTVVLAFFYKARTKG